MREDVGSGDVTTQAVVAPDTRANANLSQSSREWSAGSTSRKGVPADGNRPALRAGDQGRRPRSRDRRGLGHNRRGCCVDFTAERVALNFLQRLSGVATITAKFVEAVGHAKARIVDTRKTTPGLRALEKYAVTVGGGFNHRYGLFDGILIKDNHIVAAGSVTNAVQRARELAHHLLKVEVEAKTLEQVLEAVEARADVILLDNMSVEMLTQAVEIVGGRALTEASGGVNLTTVPGIAATGVDLISVGALTHSAPALDISLDFHTI